MQKFELSKSEYMMFLKHPAWLWLKKHNKKMLPPPDANLQAMFDAGNIFEQYAEARFDQITRVGFDNYDEYLSMPTRTIKALEAGATQLTQGRFVAEYGDNSITCIVDVIQKVDAKTFDLFEIKSSTSVKPDHIEDLAFQTVVLESAGYSVRNIAVVYCNNQYVRKGEVDLLALSIQEDVTTRVRAKIETTKRNISAAIQTISQSEMPDPTPRRVKLGAFKEWLEIFLSLKPTSDPYSIYKLAQAKPEQLGQLEDMHISSIADIPEDFALGSKQSWQVEATKLGEPIVCPEKVGAFIESLEYPLYFLDYETLSSVVPSFDGLKPYQQLPFQYSLHIIEKPGAELTHSEFLHTLDSDPLPSLLKQLQNDIGDTGTVLVWYEGFEKSCNELMGKMQPEFANFLADINSRVKDLMIPFSKGYYRDKDFYGSASIKKVLPVLAPELSYGDMDIQEGASAQRLWMQSVYENVHSAKEKANIMKNLRKYCELDTYAMVRIFEFLLALSRGEKHEESVVSIAENTLLGPAEQLSLL
ncbi:DUF2779 domain-containing protein [Candidatus Saccharibacteria bacterium]|nr:DUF2779 domain-containing protein [Candidatus Saccharibacteria bacterium]